MTLPSTPPRFGTWTELVASIRRGEQGWRVYALQKALNSILWAERAAAWERLTPDGDYGSKTAASVLTYQRWAALADDGIVGAGTQRKLLTWVAWRIHALLPGVPDGLMRGYIEGEGANVLAATNWSVQGGVDCGPGQWRVKGPPYSMAEMSKAFDPMTAILASATEFLRRADVFYQAPWVRNQAKREELAKRLAVFAHNWPSAGGADYYAEHGHVANPEGICTWAPASARFPDGARVITRGDWAQFYAMGGPHGEGAITKYVQYWD